MRLTIRNSDGTVSQPMNLDWAAALDKLAAYEDTGLEPDEIKENIGLMSPICVGCDGKTADGKRTEKCTYVDDDFRKCLERSVHLSELAHAEEQDRLVILPCKVGDTVWFYLYEDRGGIRKGVYQGIITELKAVHRLNRDVPLFLAFVRFEYRDPWYSFEQLSTSEMHCSFGEYGSWVRFYLTREEAEAALKGESSDV